MTNSAHSGSEVPAGTPASSAFEQLDERVQRWVWRQGWTELREIQERAIQPILEHSADVVLAAATAAGKTEAAFLPVCSHLAGAPGQSVRALYVSPLKALINDQYERLRDLCEGVEIPVTRWHGDVPAGSKRRLLDDPSGVLLITPESLEALFVLQGSRIRELFKDLEYAVIDELHSFLGSERGRQLQSLLYRVELAARQRIPRVALSATIGDLALAGEFVRPVRPDGVLLISSDADGRELRLQIRGYRITAPRLDDDALTAAQADNREVEVEDTLTGDALEISQHIFSTLRGQDNLVFANRRAEVETYADLLRRLCERDHLPMEFWPHHGSLSKELREDVEAMLKESTRPTTAVCTSTLELGIDIGSVESIAQIGTPMSVAALRQRLGRAGRSPGDPSVLRIYVREPEIEERTPPQDQLRAELVQSIAMVRLLLERWYEPPIPAALHLSTLVQQLLSLIAQHGGIRADDAWRVLCDRGPFRQLARSAFVQFLRALGEKDLIVQSSDDTLLLGGAGERVVNHFSFYAAFVTPEEYRLVSGERTLGTLPIYFPLAEGMYLIFGGRRWRVLAVDAERKLVELAPAVAGRAPAFMGGAGLVHDRIRQEMRAVYAEAPVPPYLNPGARALLLEGRDAFHRYGLAHKSLVEYGDHVLLFPWAGDRAMNTITMQLRARGLDVADEGIAIAVADVTVDLLENHIHELMAAGPADAHSLAAVVENKKVEKHHWALSENLLTQDYASWAFEPQTAWQRLGDIVQPGRARLES